MVLNRLKKELKEVERLEKFAEATQSPRERRLRAIAANTLGFLLGTTLIALTFGFVVAPVETFILLVLAGFVIMFTGWFFSLGKGQSSFFFFWW